MNPNYLSAFVFVRDYTHSLLDTVPPSQWFEMPGGVTHIAWQVGHLAMAELRLCLQRIRGPKPIDDDIYPPEIRKLFGKDDTPRNDPAVYPSAERFREILDRVRQQLLVELPGYAESLLDEPLADPHRLCRTKRDCLVWAPRHELIHAGQIGLLRRQLGHKPVW